MPLKAEDILITFEQMSRLVHSTERNLPCDVVRVRPGQHPTELLDALSSAQNPTCLRKQLLVDYQDHWIVLDIQRKEDGRFSLVSLDAANDALKIASFTYLLFQITTFIELNVDLMHISSLDAPLQRDKNSCPIFAWELLQWASEYSTLHAVLQTKILPREKSQGHIDVFLESIKTLGTVPTQTIPHLLNSLKKIQWLDYTSLEEIDSMSGFFINTHTLNHIPPCVAEKIDKWLIEKPHAHTSKYVVHNIRSSYCYHQIKVRLGESEESLSEHDFILREICALHSEDTNVLGKVLRKAIADGLRYQVSSLLQITEIDVNEVPASGFTALDRANSLRPSESKNKIIELLRKKGASSGAALKSMFSATQTVEVPAKEAISQTGLKV